MPSAVSLEELGIRQPPPLVEAGGQPGGERSAESDSTHVELELFAGETIANLERLVAQAEEEVASRGTDFLDELIERLAAIEEGTQKQWHEMKTTRDAARRVQRIFEDLPDAAAGKEALLHGIEDPTARIEAWIQAAEALLPAYRDARWKLMALRADHEDSGDAPVFDDPDQLNAAGERAYLREHGPGPVDRDPLLDLVGLVDDPEGPDDVAEEHDHYLYGAPKRSDSSRPSRS